MPDYNSKPTRYSNQKEILILDKEPRDKKHPYAIININALDAAFASLSPEAFIVWVALNKNQPGFKVLLSRGLIKNCLSERKYFDGVNELIAKGYLIPRKGKNNYSFVELPREQETVE